MAQKFNEGDRVRRSRGSYGGMTVGDKGTVIETWSNGEIQMEEWNKGLKYDGDNYELVEVKKPEIINDYSIF